MLSGNLKFAEEATKHLEIKVKELENKKTKLSEDNSRMKEALSKLKDELTMKDIILNEIKSSNSFVVSFYIFKLIVKV